MRIERGEAEGVQFRELSAGDVFDDRDGVPYQKIESQGAGAKRFDYAVAIETAIVHEFHEDAVVTPLPEAVAFVDGLPPLAAPSPLGPSTMVQIVDVVCDRGDPPRIVTLDGKQIALPYPTKGRDGSWTLRLTVVVS